MSELTLIIGNKNYSSWSLRAWIFLRHYNLDFTEKRVPLFEKETDATLAKYGSDYKVPILQDGELIVWDSLAILEYISENYLNQQGLPADPKARAVARSISAEMHSSFTNIRNELPMNCRKQFNNIQLSESAQREVKRIEELWEKCQQNYGSHGKWLFGDFSIADAMFVPIALRFSGYNIPTNQNATNYIKQILQHPAIIEWIDAGKQETEIIEEDEIDG